MIERLPQDAKVMATKIETTESLQVLKNCVNMKIDSNLIRNLNYLDLQNLIATIKIDEVSQLFNQLRKMKLKQKGIDKVVEASADDYKNL